MRISKVLAIILFCITTGLFAQKNKIESILIVLETYPSNLDYFRELQANLDKSLSKDFEIETEFYVLETPKIQIDTTITNSQEKRRAFFAEIQRQSRIIDKKASEVVSKSKAKYLARIRQTRQTNYIGDLFLNPEAGEFNILLFETESGKRLWTYEYDHHALNLKNRAASSSKLILRRLEVDGFLDKKKRRDRQEK